MKKPFAGLAARFNALKEREKQLVAGATLVVIAMGGYTFWAEPALLRAAALKKQIAQQRTETQGLRAQLAALDSQAKDPDAPNKAALAQARERLAAVDQALRAYDKSFVPPDRMPQLLQSLFARHRGLELVSLRTLPAAPLVPPAAKPDAKQDARLPESKNAATAANAGGVVKHGIEIKVAGGYLDLLGYVAELENLPQKLLWGSLALAVTAHPKAELTLTVYTLSLDRVWMVM